MIAASTTLRLNRSYHYQAAISVATYITALTANQRHIESIIGYKSAIRLKNNHHYMQFIAYTCCLWCILYHTSGHLSIVNCVFFAYLSSERILLRLACVTYLSAFIQHLASTVALSEPHVPRIKSTRDDSPTRYPNHYPTCIAVSFLFLFAQLPKGTNQKEPSPIHGQQLRELANQLRFQALTTGTFPV